MSSAPRWRSMMMSRGRKQVASGPSGGHVAGCFTGSPARGMGAAESSARRLQGDGCSGRWALHASSSWTRHSSQCTITLQQQSVGDHENQLHAEQDQKVDPC